jgi:two-component sensor histidine kinase
MLGVGEDTPLTSLEAFVAHVHPEDRDDLRQAVERAIASGEPLEIEFRTIHADGTTGWVLGRGRAAFDRRGGAVRLAGVALDITARKASEERQRLLLDELNHRVKNTLATVQSLAWQTGRTVAPPATASPSEDRACSSGPTVDSAPYLAALVASS